MFGKQGEAVAEYINKGRLILLEGQIKVNEKIRFNVIADRV